MKLVFLDELAYARRNFVQQTYGVCAQCGCRPGELIQSHCVHLVDENQHASRLLVFVYYPFNRLVVVIFEIKIYCSAKSAIRSPF